MAVDLNVSFGLSMARLVLQLIYETGATIRVFHYYRLHLGAGSVT